MRGSGLWGCRVGSGAMRGLRIGAPGGGLGCSILLGQGLVMTPEFATLG